ncbi:MAG: c-type cytochrome, partial [Planctomycetales bacterium]|nr:c-type cytochrome [Planctomycetales bacterium]
MPASRTLVIAAALCLLSGARASADDSDALASPAEVRANYRRYATAHDGDANRGRALFDAEAKTTCAKCHSRDGSRQGPGPDLQAIGDKFTRD